MGNPAVVMHWIGIDIGSQAVGWAVVQLMPAGRFFLHSCEAIDLGKAPLENRLSTLHTWLLDHLKNWPTVTSVAIEEPFVGKSIRSALTLGTVKGLVWSLLLSQGKPPPHRLAAVQVKKAITGRPHADKTQVAAMLQHYLVSAELPQNPHATDAIAIAIAAALAQNSPISRRLKSRAER
ncbi:MAG: crossover junction endodeoxyribonuclease RuvC [Bacteroidia bacterium]|nr:crossover junction endodeoxyribonuclease RuvC [Bacteroidia bacterium]